MDDTSIEKYRLATKSSPENLQALVPDFLPAVPNDPATNKPLVYTKTKATIRVSCLGPRVSKKEVAKDKRDRDPVIEFVISLAPPPNQSNPN